MKGMNASAVAAGFVIVADAASHAILHPAQAATKPLSELMTRAPQTRLEGVLGGAKFLCGFTGRIAFHFAEQEGGAEQRREFVEIFVNHFSNFSTRIYLLGIWHIIREALGNGKFVFVLGFVERNGRTSLGTAALHQGGINHDASEPGGELRAALKALEISVSRKQPVLESIFGVFCVAKNAQRRLEQLTVIAAKQRLDGCGIAPLPSTDQLLLTELLIA